MTVAEKLNKCSENMDWYYEHLEGLRRNAVFCEKYVAISNGRVIAVGTSYPALVKRLYAEHPKEANTAYIEHISSEPCVQIL